MSIDNQLTRSCSGAGTPFVKLGGFNDLYDEDDDDDEDDEEFSDNEPEEAPVKKSGGGKGIKFAEGTNDSSEEKEKVPGEGFATSALKPRAAHLKWFWGQCKGRGQSPRARSSQDIVLKCLWAARNSQERRL